MTYFQKINLVLFLLVGMAIIFQSCGEEGGTGSGPVLGPGRDRMVGIETGGADVSLSPTLCWHAIGEPGDSVVYDFYLGVSSNPGLVQANLSDTSYDAGPLMPGTKYYWAVGARIDGAATGKSDVYSFTTRTGITYPVAVGNRWEYRWEYQVIGLENANHCGYYVVEINRVETGWPVNPVWAFEETWYVIDTDTLAHATSYYQVADDGFYLVGYDGAGDIHPVRGDGWYRIRVNDREYGSLGDMLVSSGRPQPAASLSPQDIIYETPPKLVLEYPIAIGAEWTYRTDNPWRIDKSIDEYEIIDVPAGSFGCFVVRQDQDVDGDGNYDGSLVFRDYVAEQGLVRRSETTVNAVVLDSAGNFLGFVDVNDDYSLVAWEVE